MNIIKVSECLIKGHKVDTSESIIQDYMHDPRNWLCKCKNCGLYVMHDGAISGKSVLLTERSALKVKQEFIDEVINIRRMIYGDQSTEFFADHEIDKEEWASGVGQTFSP